LYNASKMLQEDESVQEFFSNKSKTREFRKETWVENDIILASRLIDHWKTSTCPQLRVEDNHDAFQGDSIPRKIPKVIHFIWLGSDGIPQFPVFCDEYREDDTLSDMNEAMYSWRKHHKEWQIHVWRDADIIKLLSRYDSNHKYLSAKKLYEEAVNAQKYGMASDIARIFVLYFIGGVYVDIDYICNNSFDLLHDTFEFYCGASNVGCVEINNGIIGSIQGHWFLVMVMDQLCGLCDVRCKSSSVTNFISDFLDHDSILSLKGASSVLYFSDMDVIDRTGPGMFTRAVLNIFASQQDCLGLDKFAVLPARFFHPMPNTESIKNGKSDFSDVMSYLNSNLFAVHLWSCSWQLPPRNHKSIK
jgi:hypothetical protein